MPSTYFKYSDGSYVVSRFYTNTASITTNLSSIVTKSLNGTAIDAPNTDGALTEYSKSAIWVPYTYMNSDTSGTDGKFKLSEEQLKSLVAYNDADDDYKVSDGSEETKISEIAGSEKKPKNNMLKSNWGAMFSYAFVEQVKPGGSILISESNAQGLGVISYRVFDAQIAKQFTYVIGK